MDQSLDEIIATRPKTARRGSSRRGGGARAQVLGNAGPSPAARVRQAASPVTNSAKNPTTPSTAPAADKIIVSNFPTDVTEAQIKELFHSTVGPLREVTLHYDNNGRSKGAAAVHFQKKGDGNKAYQLYNNRLIDGRRPMKIEIVVDPARPTPAQSLASRVAPLPVVAPAAAAVTAAPRNGTRGRRGRGRGGRPKSERVPKTAADLDAEMEDYTASNAPSAA